MSDIRLDWTLHSILDHSRGFRCASSPEVHIGDPCESPSGVASGVRRRVTHGLNIFSLVVRIGIEYRSTRRASAKRGCTHDSRLDTTLATVLQH